MFLLGALVRFGRFFLIFLICAVFIWLIWRAMSFVARWLYDQSEEEAAAWKTWIRSKMPRRKTKQKVVHLNLSSMSVEDLHKLAQMIADIEDGEEIN